MKNESEVSLKSDNRRRRDVREAIGALNMRGRAKRRLPGVQPARRATGKSVHEEAFLLQLKEAHLCRDLRREYRFDVSRRWRFDFAWLAVKVAVEIHGAVWRGVEGGHTSGLGRTRDMEKMNAATLLGWRVLELSDKHVRNLEGVEWLRRLLAQQSTFNDPGAL